MTLTLNFDLLLKNFNLGCYLVMVAARRASLSSDNSYSSFFLSLSESKVLAQGFKQGRSGKGQTYIFVWPYLTHTIYYLVHTL